MTILLAGTVAYLRQQDLLNTDPIYVGKAPWSHFDVLPSVDVMEAMIQSIFHNQDWKALYPIMYGELSSYNNHQGFDDLKLETKMLEIARKCSSWKEEFSGLSNEFYWLIAAIENSLSGKEWRILGIWRWFHFEEFHRCHIDMVEELDSIVQRDVNNIAEIVNQILRKEVITWWVLICGADDVKVSLYTALDWLNSGEVYLSVWEKLVDKKTLL